MNSYTVTIRPKNVMDIDSNDKSMIRIHMEGDLFSSVIAKDVYDAILSIEKFKDWVPCEFGGIIE